MRRPFFVLALLTATASPLLAQDQPVPAKKMQPAEIQAGNYRVEGNHTQVFFSISHFGFNPYFGLFGDASGSLKLDTAKLENSQVKVSIPVASLQTSSAKLTQDLPGEPWFNSAQFPTISFESISVKRTGEATADIAGNLTLHGVTKPVTLKASFVGGGANPMSKAATIGFKATTQIKRSDFGMTTYVPMIGDEVSLKISVAFEREG